MATVKIDMGYQMFLLQILIQSVSIQASIKFSQTNFSCSRRLRTLARDQSIGMSKTAFGMFEKGGEGAYIWNVYKYNVHTVQSSMKKTNDRPSESISISCGNGLYQEKFLLCS